MPDPLQNRPLEDPPAEDAKAGGDNPD